MVMDQYSRDELNALDMHEAQDAAFDRENAGYDDDPDVATDEDDERQACSCWKGSIYSPGSVASIRAGDTDPECPIHGHEDYRA